MNSKNKKITFILLFAFIVIVVTGVALYYYLVPKKTTIYVFKGGESAGTVVTEEMLTPVQADSSIVVAGAKTDTFTQFVTGENIDEVLKSKDSLRMDVASGMPLTLSMLTANGGSTIEMNMNPTMISITVPISDITGVTNELKSGSKVNIFTTGVNKDGVIETSMPFVDMKVLATSYDGDGNLYSATLECTTEQALQLVYYTSNYTLYFGLIDSNGYQFPTQDNPSFSIGATSNYVDEYVNAPVNQNTEEPENEPEETKEADTQAPTDVTPAPPIEEGN